METGPSGVGIILCGGGVIGLSAAMMLARDGHAVTVLEADPHEPPATAAEAWQSWDRKGVAQFRQPHNLFARFRQVCDEELPGMTNRLQAAGLVWTDPLAVLPRGITDRDPRAGDDVFRFVTGRRPVAESVIAAAAQEQPGVTVRRGVRMTELITGPSAIPGVPHVVGVRTSDGAELRGDLVVDAMGRRSRASELLAAQEVAAFYWSQLTADRERKAEDDEARENRPWAPPASPMTGLFNGSSYDADLFRAMIETVVCLAPEHDVPRGASCRRSFHRWS